MNVVLSRSPEANALKRSRLAPPACTSGMVSWPPPSRMPTTSKVPQPSGCVASGGKARMSNAFGVPSSSHWCA